jgi:glyoxylase-like metal-dependent hydrolase (beta-lactamase superfamily II)/rhodanese-related sulfurtransferase
MYFAQHYLDCLSQASYIIGDESSGRAVLVDPRRDIDDYLEDAATHGLAIEGVINTHFHADFLAGHLEVARATGAWIGYGSAAQPDYAIRALGDRQRIELGGPHGVALQILHTPGHTPESISVLVFEHADDEVPYGVLTGDGLFIGDVGRPDLLASVGLSAGQLAGMLYDSIHDKLMSLPDEVRVFPAHGAGSSCGKNLSTETQSTIGEQRRSNYACQPMSKEQFVALVTDDQPLMPEYFGYDAVLNQRLHQTWEGAQPQTVDFVELCAAVRAGAVILDSRDAIEYAAGHLRGSVSVPLDGRFAETVGMLLQPEQDIVIITPEGHAVETATRLARIGFDRVVGHLSGIERVLIEVDDSYVGQASRLTPAALDAVMGDDTGGVLLVDVRNPGELETGEIPWAHHVPLPALRRRLAEVRRDGPIVLYCAGGWRSAVAASYLRSQGYSDVSDMIGGYEGWLAHHKQLTR